MSKRKDNIRAAERLDVLEAELPRSICAVRGCERSWVMPLAGAFGTRYFCARHRPLYRAHNEIVRRIREL